MVRRPLAVLTPPRPLLGVPAVDLVGRMVPLDEPAAAPARRLARELRDLEPEEVVPHLARSLPDLSGAADRSRTALVTAGADALSTRTGRVPGPVRDVARELAVSERQLRDLFAEGVGLSPKHYARISRVRAVPAQAHDVPWAQLAATTGYYDQSPHDDRLPHPDGRTTPLLLHRPPPRRPPLPGIDRRALRHGGP
ncbi:helix-turn-helix domain-containing protein [Streptomyces chartreusis]|uniref:helix-turn-helix domain-containing protein n=1 Tax=Streptomyces chartreusis TaxID=1969 RepID=UPI00362993DD